MTCLVIKAQRKQPYGHTAYTRASKTGKLVQVQAKGVKPVDLNAKLWSAAVDEFGLTDDPREAGYILPDGKMLDLSQKREGGSPGQRSDDHRSIRRAFVKAGVEVGAEYSDALIEAINRGALRISFNQRRSGASLSVEGNGNLTNAQRRRLTSLVRQVDDVSLDIQKKNGDKSHSEYFEGRITPRQVFNFFDKPSEGSETVKSLLTEDPHRKKDYAHITHTHGGKRVRAKHHKPTDGYTPAHWLSDTVSKLTEYATETMEEGHGSPKQWLEDRGIRLPDREDAVTRRTINQWLCTYGHNMFTLGMHVTDASGKTIASPEELPRIQKGLVVRVNLDDLEKAGGRLAGAKGKVKFAKITWGVIEFPGTSHEPHYMTEKEVGKEQEIILRYQQQKGITGVHHAPPVKTPEYVKRRKAYQRKVGRAQKQLQGALAQRKAPSPEAKNIQEVEGKLKEQRATGEGSVSMIDILHKRVQDWTKPKVGTKVDPLFKEQRRDLLKRKRELNKKLKLGRGNDKAKAAVSKDYKEVMNALNRMETERHVKSGGGLTKFGEREFKLVEHGIVDEEGKKVPYKDLGFQPFTKPMSYLLSMTDWPRNKKGNYVFSKKQREALDHEYQMLVAKTASTIINKYRLYEQDHEGGPRRKSDDAKEVESIAYSIFSEMINDWKRHEKGHVNEHNNFAKYMYGLYPGRVRDEFVRRRKKQKKEVHAEDIDSMPEMPGGKTMTPGVRVESQQDALRRPGLNKWVGEIFAKLLNDPVQQAVIESRLNIYKEQEEGVKEDVLSWPKGVKKRGRHYYAPKEDPDKKKDPKAQEMVEEKSGFKLKPWKKVKEEVVDRLGKMRIPEQEKEKQRKLISRMSAGDVNKLYFMPALHKLRTHEHGLSHKERAVLTEFASLNRKYLQGIRHETWDPSESIGKLKVKRTQRSPQSRGRMRHADPEGFLATRKRKGDLKRSLVIPDYIGAISALIDECEIWRLNGV